MGAIVTDFWPLKDPVRWVDDVKKAINPDIPIIQVNRGLFTAFKKSY